LIREEILIPIGHKSGLAFKLFFILGGGGCEEKNPVLPAKTYNPDCLIHDTVGKAVLHNI
jgi:hypothetical protein